jgi:hypothetical protein
MNGTLLHIGFDVIIPREEFIAPNAVTFEKHPALREKFIELSRSPRAPTTRRSGWRNSGAAGARLRERVPRRHRAVHGPLQFLPRR